MTSGAVLVHVPHTTAAVTVNEGYDPDVAADVVRDLCAGCRATPDTPTPRATATPTSRPSSSRYSR